MKLLDLFSGAGGAATGYHRAGFNDITGIDHKPQKNYPFKFIQADALEYLAKHGKEYDVIHASPPCQLYCSMRSMWNARFHADLVPSTRELLEKAGKLYVIENVPGADLIDPTMLCGSMFRLGCDGGELRRHRIFEVPTVNILTPPCDHGWSGPDKATVGVYGNAGGYSKRQRYCTIGVYGGHGRDRRRIKNGQHFRTSKRAEAMGIGWMTGRELSQAIPPAYTEFIGRRILEIHLKTPPGAGKKF